MNNVLTLISYMIIEAAQIYTWYKIPRISEKPNYIKCFVFIIIYSLLIISITNINIYIKPIILLCFTMLICKYIINKSFKECIIINFMSYFIILILDGLFGCLLLVISNTNLSKLLTEYSGGIFTNIIIAVLLVLTVNLKFINKMYILLINNTKKLKEHIILILLFIIIICSSSTFLLTYYKNNVSFAIILNIIITFVYATIVLIIIKTKNKYIIVNSKYNMSLENLYAQEQIINDYRLLNHENKNTLLTIKGMTKSKKIVSYIDSLLKQKNNIGNQIIQEIIKIPEGGIRGLIYSKILVMKEKGIKYNINIDKKVNTKVISSISDNDIVDICQILGVFIDNAIEESVNNIKKEINLDIYISNKKLFISISNYHNQQFNLSNKNTLLKTTKGEEHGYGLKLVKRIVNNNANIKNERIITRNIFKQIIIIKI